MTVLPLVAFLAACYQSAGHTDDLGYYEVTCDEVVTPVAWDDASAGFTADDVLAVLGSPLQFDVTWDDLTPDSTSATLVVTLAENLAETPAVVLRSDAADHPGGCSYFGPGTGTFLRIPLDLVASDLAGRFTFSAPCPVGHEDVFTLDASSSSPEGTWFLWEFRKGPDVETCMAGPWWDGVQACVEGDFGDEVREYEEIRLWLLGSPASGEADISVGTNGDDDSALGSCWRRCWGSADPEP
jgi:hypothetical protein